MSPHYQNLQHTKTIFDYELQEILSGRVVLTNVTATSLAEIRPPRLYFAAKRAGELFLSLVFCPLIMTICLLSAILIKLDSPGPALFRQQRVGLRGRTFLIFKLRTMTHSESRRSSNQFAEIEDTRVTRVGRWLRNYRIDELPQFWNVIRGDMSLIGPRPEQPAFVDQFSRSIPFYAFRHNLRPGITGWAQVRYKYAASENETREKLEYDLFYIKHMSLWLDFNILLITIHTIFFQKGVR